MGVVSWTHGAGPLVPFSQGFRKELLRLGHAPSTVKRHIGLMGQLNRWLLAEGLSVDDLKPTVIETFVDRRRAAGVRRVVTRATFAPLIGYLRNQEALAPEEPAAITPQEDLLARYTRHLEHDRGLAPTTVDRYVTFAKRFLVARVTDPRMSTGAENLSSAEIHAYLLGAGTRLVVESAKREAADLRALLRFLYLERLLEADLGSAMPPIATWRGRRLPSAMSARDVDTLLESCSRATRAGRRDYAILTLLARLGLRSAEVAAIQLGDVDWRAGEITVRGKARRQDRLPLPVEVGEAVVDYLKDGRPSGECRHLILTLHAPARPIRPCSITNVVYRACRRARLPRIGGHRLRHALATEMLRQGGDLLEIAQVLRHSDLATTSAYAKVDRIALRSVAQPWPGAAQ
jgi:integrase/recombinase XerD